MQLGNGLRFIVLVGISVIAGFASFPRAVDDTVLVYNYQGDLQAQGKPATGSYDISFMLDKVDIEQENWYNIDTEDGWGDEPDSIKYRAPVGHQILLFKNQNLNGEILRLVRNGQVQSISRLDDYGFGDVIHSVYMGAYPYAGGAMVSMIGVSQSISTSLGYSGRLEVVTLQGVFVDPLPWSVGSGSDVLIRAQSNQETFILAP